MKQEKVRTRKQTALRRLNQLFTVVLIVAVYCGANLGPRQAARDIAEHLDMEENKAFIECVYDPSLPETKTALRYLVDNGQAMMLCTVKWDLFMGWYDWDWCKVETWEDAPLHAGLLSHRSDDQFLHYLFARMDDERIAEVALCFDRFSYSADGTLIGKTRSSISIPKDAIFRSENGGRYLLTSVTDALPMDPYNTVRYQEIHLLGYDRAGTVIADEEVRWASWSS